MLHVDHRDDVSIVVLEHGPVSALDVQLLDALAAAVAEAPGPVVLTGTGKAFSAGVDLKRVVAGGAEYAAALVDALSRAFLAVFSHPRPTVAAVNGHAVAGGCVLALACDARLMSAGRIGLTELAVGVQFPRAGLEVVRHALGPATGRVVLQADTVEADEALRLGLVDAVVAPDDLLDRATALARRLGAYPAAVYAATKEELHRPVLDAVAAGDDQDAMAVWTSTETQHRLADQLAAMSARAATSRPSA